ncbi:MAG: TolC family protein [Gammaproteobacteria bacterium]
MNGLRYLGYLYLLQGLFANEILAADSPSLRNDEPSIEQALTVREFINLSSTKKEPDGLTDGAVSMNVQDFLRQENLISQTVVDSNERVLEPTKIDSVVERNETEFADSFRAPFSNVDSKLELRTAVRQALSSHPAVAESMGNFYSTLEQVDVAKAGYFPRLRAGLGNGYQRSASNSWNRFNISASQTVYDFGKVSSSVDIASSNADRKYADALLAMDDLALDTAEAFIEVQRHQALVEIAKDQVQAIAQIQELANARSSMGASTKSDVLQALSRHEAALATELQIQAQLGIWRRTLQSYLGRAVNDEVDSGFPSELDQACLSSPENFDNVPMVVEAEAALNEALARTRKAKADQFPTISFNANYGSIGNPSDVSFNPQLNERDVSFSLSIDSSLFQGGASRARRQSAEYSVRAARAGKEVAMLEVSRRFREAHDQTSSYIDRLAYLESRYVNIVDTQALYREQYLSLGTRTLLDILNTEQEIHQSRFEREDTIFDLRQLQMGCLHSVGQLRSVFDIDSSMSRGSE